MRSGEGLAPRFKSGEHAWPTNSTTGRRFRAAANSCASRWRKPAPAYVDVARDRGTDALIEIWEAEDIETPPFAPPFLKHGKRIIGQSANILLYLGDRHDLAPKSEAGRFWTHQIQLTIADLVVEAHDTHHPLGGDAYYEEQKPEAQKRAAAFPEAAHPEIPRLVRNDPRTQSERRRLSGRSAGELRRPVTVPERSKG